MEGRIQEWEERLYCLLCTGEDSEKSTAAWVKFLSPKGDTAKEGLATLFWVASRFNHPQGARYVLTAFLCLIYNLSWSTEIQHRIDICLEELFADILEDAEGNYSMEDMARAVEFIDRVAPKEDEPGLAWDDDLYKSNSGF